MIIIFIKAPIPGKVKTRLTPVLNENLSCQLYKKFTEDIFNAAQKSTAKITLCYLPKFKKKQIQTWLGMEYTMIPQTGTNIGERMKQAFMDVFSRGEKKAVLIGTDIPDLDSATLKKALNSLNSHDSVIGPSKDGGYYLIGFNNHSFPETVFHNIKWSTSSVLDETLCILKTSKHSTYLLEEKNDIDTPDDLKDFIKSDDRSSAKRTWKFIQKNINQFTNDF